MARAKKSKNLSARLPAGFKAIEGGGNSWQPNKIGESITGMLIKTKSVHIKKKGSMPAREMNLHTLQTATGPIDVWQSAGLKAMAGIKKKTVVYIQYTGKRVITKGQNPMREFLVATK